MASTNHSVSVPVFTGRVSHIDNNHSVSVPVFTGRVVPHIANPPSLHTCEHTILPHSTQLLTRACF